MKLCKSYDKQYGDYVKTEKDKVDKAKELLLEKAKQTLEEAAKDDGFWIIKTSESNPSYLKENEVTVGFRIATNYSVITEEELREKHKKAFLEAVREYKEKYEK